MPCRVVDEPKERFWNFNLTPDGRALLYGVHLRDARTGAVLKPARGTPALIWDGEGRSFVVQSEQLRRFDMDTLTVGERVADVPGYYYDGHLVGARLLFVRKDGQQRQLVSLDLKSTRVEPLFHFAADLPERAAVTAFAPAPLLERGIRFKVHPPSSSCAFKMDLRGISDLAAELAKAKPGECPNVLVMPDGGAAQSYAFTLRRFAKDGTVVWAVPHAADMSLGMALSDDGRWVGVRAEDGTLRLMNAATGHEAVAVFEQLGKWVMATPSGYYDTSPGGEDLLGWHVQRGGNVPADFFPVSRFRSQFYRPDVVAQVLATQNEAQAIELSNQAAGRRPQQQPLQAVLPPTVALVSPGDGDRVSQTPVRVRVAVRTPAGAPVTALRVRVNGQPQTVVRGLARADAEPKAAVPDSELLLEVQMPPHDSDIQVFAENRHGVSAPASGRLAWSGPANTPSAALEPYKPKLYVLAVGVSRYANPEYYLGLAAKDATDFAAVLSQQKGRLYADVKMKLLTDDKATKDEVLDGLEWLKREVTARDVGVVFLAGHGINDNTGAYYFLPHNADTNRLMRTGVPQADIKSTLNTLAGKALFFVDTCHAGNALGTAKTRSTSSVTDALVNELASAENGVVVFAASTGRQLSQEDSAWGNGAFTKALVEGLSGRADFQKNGKITHKGLDYYVAERVKALTRGTQSPVSITPNGISDFPIAVVP